MTIDTSSAADAPRSRKRTVALRVGIVAQLVIAAAGAYGMWDDRAAGRAVSRPSAIAFWAGLAGLVASLVGPRIRESVRSRRRGS